MKFTYKNNYASYYNKLTIKTLYKYLDITKLRINNWIEFCKIANIPIYESETLRTLERAYNYIEDSIIQKERAQRE